MSRSIAIILSLAARLLASGVDPEAVMDRIFATCYIVQTLDHQLDAFDADVQAAKLAINK